MGSRATSHFVLVVVHRLAAIIVLARRLKQSVISFVGAFVKHLAHRLDVCLRHLEGFELGQFVVNVELGDNFTESIVRGVIVSFGLCKSSKVCSPVKRRVQPVHSPPFPRVRR